MLALQRRSRCRDPDSLSKVAQTVKLCGTFAAHVDGSHLLHSTYSVRTSSIRGGCMTPQVGTVTCQPAPKRGDKRHGVHNRVVDLSLQQVLLRGCSLHSTPYGQNDVKQKQELNRLPHKQQVLWLPKDDLQDPSSWSSSPLLLLRDIHYKLITQFNCKEGCVSSQSQDHVGAGDGLRSQDDVSSRVRIREFAQAPSSCPLGPPKYALCTSSFATLALLSIF